MIQLWRWPLPMVKKQLAGYGSMRPNMALIQIVLVSWAFRQAAQLRWVLVITIPLRTVLIFWRLFIFTRRHWVIHLFQKMHHRFLYVPQVMIRWALQHTAPFFTTIGLQPENLRNCTCT